MGLSGVKLSKRCDSCHHCHWHLRWSVQCRPGSHSNSQTWLTFRIYYAILYYHADWWRAVYPHNDQTAPCFKIIPWKASNHYSFAAQSLIQSALLAMQQMNVLTLHLNTSSWSPQIRSANVQELSHLVEPWIISIQRVQVRKHMFLTHLCRKQTMCLPPCPAIYSILSISHHSGTSVQLPPLPPQNFKSDLCFAAEKQMPCKRCRQRLLQALIPIFTRKHHPFLFLQLRFPCPEVR